LRTLIVFFALSGIACGQNLLEAGFGVRGGLLLNKSFQGSQFCVLACNLSTPDKLYETAGPAVNVLLYNRVEVRFEAVHRRFESQVQSADFVMPNISQIGSENAHCRDDARKAMGVSASRNLSFLIWPDSAVCWRRVQFRNNWDS
jgi:hypothetical protein